MIVLRGVRGHFKDSLRRRRNIADRQTADLSRSRQIRLHQRRRQRQRPRDVVEPVGRIVGRQEFRGVHFEREDITNRVGIFGAVEAMHAGRNQIGGGAAVEFLLHERDHGFEYRRSRTRHARGRHHPGAKLAHDLFPGLGVVVHTGGVELIEQQSSGLQALVVAGDAILIEEGALGSRRRYCGDGRGSLLRAGDLEKPRQGDNRHHSREAQQTISARRLLGARVMLGARAANAALTFTHLAPKNSDDRRGSGDFRASKLM